MKCPNCNETLVMTDRQGVEIDYCPNCRGVWLDKGELDKIIERSAQYEAGYRKEEPGYRKEEDDDRYYSKDDYKRQPYPPKKKRGFLGDMFDFD
jgi:Zn-finger nucleic acid-binding protein